MASWAEAAAQAGVAASALVRVDGVPEAVAALRSGKATAAIIDVVDYLQQRRLAPVIQLGLSLDSAQSSVWGVRKSDPGLGRALDPTSASSRVSLAGAAAVKYFGDDAPLVLGHKPVN